MRGLFIFVVAGLFIFSSCSRVDLVLSLAPRYMANEVDDAFDLTSKRYAKVKEALVHDIDLNKKELLGLITNQLDKLLRLLATKDFKTEDLQLLFDESKEIQKKIIYAFKPSFSEVLLQLSSDELSSLNTYANDRLKKTQERLNNKKNYDKHYTKIYVRYMDFLFDFSTDEQDQIYKKFIDSNYDYYLVQFEERKSFLKQFEILFAKKNELVDYSLKYYAGDPEVKSKNYAKSQIIFYRNIIILFVDLWKVATDRQKVNFRKNLTRINDELKNLMH